ncbi:fungal-specific transcription factor domain-containing protein [Xylogone sp. PMI_703]|nr:fungal-specific transcription factor domain-containing protein [Xylogone sp. PMI_703]
MLIIPEIMDNGVQAGERPPKRKRTSVACRNCRERKLRCSGIKPSCSACVQSGLSCNYQESRPNRIRFVMHNFDESANDVEKQPDAPQDSATPLSTADSINESKTLAQVRSIRIPFFRWFGPTGIAPGYKKMLFDVTRPVKEVAHIESISEFSAETRIAASVQSPPGSPLFEEDGITPVAAILYPLLQTFFDNYGCHFPFYSRDSFVESVKLRKVSALVLNSICGLSAPFYPLPQLESFAPYLRGHIFAEKAKLLLVPLLNLPSYDVVASILMIVWLELASNHDVGVWMYMGMACRMAMDLGMHKASISGPDRLSPAEYWTVSRVWFSVYHLDHIISFATGRPLSIERKYIDVPQLHIDTSEYPSPFPSMVIIMQTLGLLHDELNVVTDQVNILAPETKEKLLHYNDELIRYYTNLPSALSFNIDNFQRYVSKGEGGTFLMLHLWFNAIMIGLHRPGLRYGQGVNVKHVFLTSESQSIALSSARTISSILSLVEVVDMKSLVSSPFIDQAVEMAGLLFIAESSSASNPLKRITNRSNYEVCLRTLRNLIRYWKGVSWVTTTMEQQARGMNETDPAEGSVDPYSLIELQDTKMIQKLLDKAEESTSINHLEMAQKSIGVGFSGLTNDSGPGNIMFLHQQRGQDGSTGDNSYSTDEPQNMWTGDSHFVSESALIDGEIWNSWIDDRFWEDMDVSFDTLSSFDIK